MGPPESRIDFIQSQDTDLDETHGSRLDPKVSSYALPAGKQRAHLLSETLSAHVKAPTTIRVSD